MKLSNLHLNSILSFENFHELLYVCWGVLVGTETSILAAAPSRIWEQVPQAASGLGRRTSLNFSLFCSLRAGFTQGQRAC